MRNFSRIIFSVMLACAAGLNCGAQQYRELQDYLDNAGGLSLLYRGRTAPRIKALANGNPYWSSPEFKTGDIVFDGLLYTGVLINFDASTQTVLVSSTEGNVFAIGLPSDKVECFTMGDDRFVKIEGRKDIPSGFHHEIFNGRYGFYKHVVKHLESSTAVQNGSAIGYEDPAYNFNLVNYFHYLPAFYLRDASGNYKRIRSKAALLRCFPKQKKAIRKYLAGRFSDPSGLSLEAYAAETLKFVEQ